MTQKFKFTFVLLFLNAVTFITLFLISNNQYKEYSKPRGLNGTISMVTQELKTIEVFSKQLQDSIKLTKRKNDWVITDPLEWPANNFSVNQILHKLNLLEESAKFTYKELIETDQDLEDYGLNEPKLILKLKSNSSSLNLEIGNPTPLGNKLYLYIPQHAAIYIVNSNLLTDEIFKLDDLYRKQIFDIPNFEIDALNYRLKTSKIDNRGRLTVRLEKNINDNSWQFISPLNVEANAVLVRKTIQALGATEVEKFVSSDIVDSNMLGFENPFLSISLQGNKRRNTLILGNLYSEQGNNRSYYAKLEGNSTVFTVKGVQYDQLIQAHKDLREKNFVKIKKDIISTLDIVDFKNHTKLQKLENDEWQAISLNKGTPTKPFQADNKVVADLIDEFRSLRAVDFFADSPTKEDLNTLNFNNPLLQISASTNGESIFEVSAVQHPYNESLLLAKTQNDPTIFAVEKEPYLEKIKADPLFYKNRVVENFPAVARILELQIKDIGQNTTLLDYNAGSENNEILNKDLNTLIKELKEFRVKKYINNLPLEGGNISSEMGWKYKLTFKISLPGDIEDKIETRTYYLGEILSGTSMIGSNSSQTLTFDISDNLIEALSPFIISEQPSLENFNQEFEAIKDKGESEIQ